MGEVILPVGVVSNDLLSATIEETKEILAKVFSYTSPDGNLTKLPPKVKRFLKAYLDIFKSERISLETPSVTQVCVGTYRHLFRKQFRVVRYLPPGKLEEVCADAKRETGKLMDDLHVLEEQRAAVMKLLEQEISWVREVNGFRRRKILESIMGEVKDTFKAGLQGTFPFRTDTCFYEEVFIKKKISELETSARESCRREVPFEEEVLALNQVDQQLVTDLKAIANDVVMENREHRRLAEKKSADMIYSCVTNFQQAMTTYLTRVEPLPDAGTISEMFQELREEFTPRFYDPPNGIEIGSPEHRVRWWNTYSDRIYCQLQLALISHETKQKNHFRLCQANSVESVKKCMGQVAGQMASSGVTGDSQILTQNVLTEVTAFFKKAEDGNKETYAQIMKGCTKCRYYTGEQELFLKHGILTKLENYFLNILQKQRSFDERKTPESWAIFCKKTQDQVLSTVPLHMFSRSFGQDILKTFTTVSSDRGQRRVVESTPVLWEPIPFRAIREVTTENGGQLPRLHRPPSKYQCLTVMPECGNKSFEEIRLEDYQCFRNVTLLPITEEGMKKEVITLVESFNAPLVIPFNFMNQLTLSEGPRERGTGEPVTFSTAPEKAIVHPKRRAKR